jgi:lipoate-protein ligase A
MTDLADREWRLVREEARPGPVQMALDEIAAETAADGGPRTVRTYRWEPSCLSLGYRQSPDTVNWEHCERAGVDVTRRQTGGGGIYHDAVGDVSYSIVAPAAELPGDLMDSYHLLCAPVLDAFERLGVPARFVESERPALHEPACYLRALHPAHDVVVPDDGGGAGTAERNDGSGVEDGDRAGGDGRGAARVRKVAGNAQYRRKDAVIQHGSLTYSVRAAAHLDVFADPGVSPDRFCERVTGIDEHADCSRAEAVATLEAALADWADAEEGSWTDDELDRARERAAEKYASDDWVRRRTQA